MINKPYLVGAAGIMVLAVAGVLFYLTSDDGIVPVVVETAPAPQQASPPAAPERAQRAADNAASAISPSSTPSPESTSPAPSPQGSALLTDQAPGTDQAPETDQTPGIAAPRETAEEDSNAGPEAPGPSFDIVRVDPEGNAVIAGKAEPNATVRIRDGERKLGEIRADDRGDWVFLPDEKLPEGSSILTLETTPENGGEIQESGNAVVVVIPEKGKDISGQETARPSRPLAMVIPREEAPDTPTRILQAPSPAAKAPVTKAPAGTAPASPAATATATAPTVPAAATPAPSGQTASRPDTAAPARTGTAPATTADGTPAGEASPPVPSVTATVTARSGTSPQKTEPETGDNVVSAAPKARSFPETASGTPQQEQEQETGITLDVIDYDDEGEVVFSGKGEPETDVQVYVDNELAARTRTDGDGAWSATPDTPIEAGTHQVRVDKVTGDGKVLARIELPFVRAEPFTGLPEDSVVIIQPGNNLWRIASRIYGSGVRYTEIYQANSDQIRDPDLIYPGQVFGLPTLN